MVIKIEKSLLRILAVVVIAAIALTAWITLTATRPPRAVSSSSAAVQTSTSPASQLAPASPGVTKENSEGEVTVSVTPVAAGDAELSFDIAINTHTADLSAFDPENQIVLTGADGKDTLSSSVTREGSGHHQNLQITFPTVEKPWKLLVRDVGGISEREFSW